KLTFTSCSPKKERLLHITQYQKELHHMGKARLSYLLERYSTNTCTREEMEELFRLSGQEDAGELLRALHGQWEQTREMNGVEGIPSETTDCDGLFRAMME